MTTIYHSNAQIELTGTPGLDLQSTTTTPDLVAGMGADKHIKLTHDHTVSVDIAKESDGVCKMTLSVTGTYTDIVAATDKIYNATDTTEDTTFSNGVGDYVNRIGFGIGTNYPENEDMMSMFANYNTKMVEFRTKFNTDVGAWVNGLNGAVIYIKLDVDNDSDTPLVTFYTDSTCTVAVTDPKLVFFMDMLVASNQHADWETTDHRLGKAVLDVLDENSTDVTSYIPFNDKAATSVQADMTFTIVPTMDTTANPQPLKVLPTVAALIKLSA